MIAISSSTSADSNSGLIFDNPAPFVPTVVTPALVSALSVYAVGRKSFEAVTRCEIDKNHAKALIFTRLKLTEFGWPYRGATITPAGRDKDGFPIWRISRE